MDQFILEIPRRIVDYSSNSCSNARVTDKYRSVMLLDTVLPKCNKRVASVYGVPTHLNSPFLRGIKQSPLLQHAG